MLVRDDLGGRSLDDRLDLGLAMENGDVLLGLQAAQLPEGDQVVQDNHVLLHFLQGVVPDGGEQLLYFRSKFLLEDIKALPAVLDIPEFLLVLVLILLHNLPNLGIVARFLVLVDSGIQAI